TSSLKRKDMEKRKEIIEKVNPALVVSVHLNKYPVSSRAGAQVFYKKGDENGKALAEAIQKSFNGMEESLKSYSALTGDYYILNCTEIPSVICECGFLSNPREESLLITMEYQRTLAYNIFCGIVSYFARESVRYF
ncbi:MAG: N-acetylmuramoyl-L-alanine amidase, partial [Clostridia bacterium]|nr:N-acetylmuramoyl-L-alanine amidase [Clostridia bacterium]